MMLETLLVHVDPGDYQWRATAIRMTHDDPWHTFIAWGDEDRHLSPLETEFVPSSFEMTGEDMLAKLVVLLGRPWQEVWDNPLEVIGFQVRALDALTDDTLRHIESCDIEDIERWVGEVNTLSEGELLRATVTGDNALALRN